ARDPVLANRSLDIALGREPSPSTGLLMISRVAVGNPDLAWEFTRTHFDELKERLDAMQRLSFLPSLTATATSPERFADLRHHFAREPAQLLLELARRQAFGPVDHEVLEAGILRLDRLDAVDHV